MQTELELKSNSLGQEEHKLKQVKDILMNEDSLRAIAVQIANNNDYLREFANASWFRKLFKHKE